MNGLEKAVALIQALEAHGGNVLDRLPESIAQKIHDRLDIAVELTSDLYDEVEKEVYVLETKESAQLVAEDQRVQRIITELEGESVPVIAFVLRQLDTDSSDSVIAGFPSAQRLAIRDCKFQDNPIQTIVASVILDTIKLD
ncbi:MAG: hypothetical protein P8L47_02875 [Candidatus Marinamargulisbacteria bacterium]|nr:hypothetical protein [bacterium]MDG2265047.1 hypothetical protein [Candidatus Marinamargulisbacteria bacterium]|tara:strand:+ start:5038 stop:5460 length:423 start_codon:yes stop_codon:yes gene_type:complete